MKLPVFALALTFGAVSSLEAQSAAVRITP